MRTIVIAGLLTFAAGGVGQAAEHNSLDKAAKKTSDGLGELLKGMGQEIKKTGIVGDSKKEDKKAEKPSEPKGKEDRKSP